MASGSIRKAYITGRFATWTRIVVSSTMCSFADGSLASLEAGQYFCHGNYDLHELIFLYVSRMYQPGRVVHGQLDVAVLPVPDVDPALVRLDPPHEEPRRHGQEPPQVDVGRGKPE